ncbi:MAG: hypothetical protein RLZZ450_4729 [Pseudomonadota bacterium]|jgi:uncharacterized membrane protein YedE/YeeE
MHDFTPLSALVGGGLIGVAASVLLLASGRIAGISGILGGLLTPTRGDRSWRIAFLFGLLVSGAVAAWIAPHSIGSSPRSLPLLVVAGLLVGVGTRLGNGCTSGHGVCGMSRLSPRSLVATVTFITAGMLIVRVIAWVGGSP